MTVNQILKIGLINDNIEVIIRDGDFQILSHGNWYQDEVLKFADYQVEVSPGRMTTKFILMWSSNNSTKQPHRERGYTICHLKKSLKKLKKYRDVCFPITKEFQEKLNDAVLDTYQQAKEQAMQRSLRLVYVFM